MSRRARSCILVSALAIAPSVMGAQSRRAPESFRFLSWNVSDDEWLTHAEASRTLLRQADPDVLAIIEVSPETTPGAVKRMLSGLRDPADTVWFISIREGVRGEHEVIASRDSVRSLPEFEFVAYPDSGELAARAGLPELRRRGVVLSVKTNGALVHVGRQWVFVVAVHLPSDGDVTSPNEYRRRIAASEVRRHTQSVLQHVSPAAVVVGGDLNLIAGSAPLDTLLQTILPQPLGAMRRAAAVHPDGHTDWTWDGQDTPIGNRRFDHVLYSSGTLTEVEARVWNTDDARSINRHRPVVIDFILRR